MSNSSRCLALGVSLLVALGCSAYFSAVASAGDSAPGGRAITEAARSGGVAEPAALPQKAATKAAAPSGKAAPQVQVRVISIPLQECPADDNEGMNAVRAFIDPATGELRAPTPEEEAALARAIAPRFGVAAQRAEKVLVGPDGRLSFVLGEDAMQDVVVRTDSDGKLVFICVPRAETPKALTRPLPPKKDAAPEEKE